MTELDRRLPFTRPRSQSIMTLLLKDTFQRFYGEGWEEAYRQPAIKDFFLREVQDELAKGIAKRTASTAGQRTAPTPSRVDPARSPASSELQ